MPTTDVRPARWDVRLRPGNTHPLTLAWPADSLDDRTFTATVLGVDDEPLELDLDVTGDTMTVTFEVPEDTPLTSYVWQLTETTIDEQVLIAGRLLLSNLGTNDQDDTATIVLADDVTVTVTVLGEPGPAGGEASHPDLAAHNTLGLATQAELDAEATTRAAADVALDGRLDTIEAISIATDAELAAAVEAHRADTTNVHGIADTGDIVLTDDARLSDARTPTAHAASHQDGGADELALDGSQITTGTVADARIAATIARDSEVTAAVAAHVDDTADAHDASAVSVVPAGGIAATTVQAALEELDTEKSATGHDHDAAYLTLAAADERIDDRVAALLVAGTNITLTYNDVAGTLTIDAAGGGGGGLTQEQAEDIVAALIDDNSDLDWTYDDATASLVAVIKPGSVTNAMLAGGIDLAKLATDPLARANHTGTQTASTISDLTETVQDLVGAMATDGTTVNFTYDDTAGTLTAEVQGLTSANLSDFAEAVRDRLGATLVAGAGITVTVDDPGDTVTITAEVTQAELDAVSAAIPNTEAIQDIVGGMVSGNTETGIAVTYDDTNGKLDFVADVLQAEVDAKANDADVVHDTGAETIAGVKTFSSDPLIPDEAYDATNWNGVLEPPTKNAVRDAIEGLSGAYVALTDYEDADVLAKVKNVDGPGSGLDADTLDGQQAAAFATAAQGAKVDFLTVTQAVDLDTIEARVNSLDAAVVLRGSWDASAGTFPGGGTAQAGDSYIVTVAGTVDGVAFALNDRILAVVDNASTGTFAANWLKLDYTDQVLSVAGQTGAVTLVKGDVGLGNADNTSDANKPVSTAQQTALDAKLAKVAGGASVEDIGAIESNVNTVAVSGSTETLDTSVYGVHDVTMDQACTFTFSNPAPSGKNTTFVLILRGAFTPTLPASVDWPSGVAPTYTTPSIYVFTTVDAGTTWLGSQVGRAFA